MNLYLIEAKVQLVHLLRNFRLKPFTFYLGLTTSFRFKPYGDMPKQIRWDIGAFIGQSEYKVRLERREI